MYDRKRQQHQATNKQNQGDPLREASEEIHPIKSYERNEHAAEGSNSVHQDATRLETSSHSPNFVYAIAGSYIERRRSGIQPFSCQKLTRQTATRSTPNKGTSRALDRYPPWAAELSGKAPSGMGGGCAAGRGGALGIARRLGALGSGKNRLACRMPDRLA